MEIQTTERETPSIRFKNFNSAWEIKALGECVLIQRGGSPRPIESFITQDLDGINWIKIGDVEKGSRYITKTAEKIRPEGALKSRAVYKGDLILSNSMSFGRPYLLAIDGCIHDGWLLIRNEKGLFDLDFLLQLLSSGEMTKQYRSLAAGGVVNNLNSALVQSAKISFPTTPEQIKLGIFFRELDQLFMLHQRKHDKLAALKKAMLQKMFPKPGAAAPEIRFKGFTKDWSEKRLGDCVLIQRGGSPRPIERFITQDDNGINWVKIGDVKVGSRYITHTAEKILPEGAAKSREVFKGDLILSNSMSFGRPYLMAIDGCIHDGWLLIRNDKNLFDLDYLLQLLSSESVTEQYNSLASGGVVNNLNSALVQSTKVSFPDKLEQQKIGAYFRNLDTLITQHATQLQKLQQIKSACLEKMFA